MKKILAIGDSIVKGVSYEEGRYHVNPERFTNLLEKQWNISIENKGRMGSTISNLVKEIDRSKKFLNSPECDTVFLSYGGNDCDYDWQAVADSPDTIHICRTEYNEFRNLYLIGIDRIKSLGKRVCLLSLPPIDASKYFHFITKDRNADAVLHWLQGDVNLLMHWHEMFNLAIFKIGEIAKVAVLDITSCFLAKPNYTEYLCDDGIHPNILGHKLIANAIMSQMD